MRVTPSHVVAGLCQLRCASSASRRLDSRRSNRSFEDLDEVLGADHRDFACRTIPTARTFQMSRHPFTSSDKLFSANFPVIR